MTAPIEHCPQTRSVQVVSFDESARSKLLTLKHFFLTRKPPEAYTSSPSVHRVAQPEEGYPTTEGWPDTARSSGRWRQLSRNRLRGDCSAKHGLRKGGRRGCTQATAATPRVVTRPSQRLRTAADYVNKVACLVTHKQGHPETVLRISRMRQVWRLLARRNSHVARRSTNNDQSSHGRF